MGKETYKKILGDTIVELRKLRRDVHNSPETTLGVAKMIQRLTKLIDTIEEALVE